MHGFRGEMTWLLPPIDGIETFQFNGRRYKAVNKVMATRALMILS